ncbi:ATP-binding cassette subfamily B protein [Nocardioides zeae]|uniref:ATP-binding cassette subfamily B protein n=1 Tax=Nocardioides zeae TaxID=1457234 RepID=A0ACC6IDD1_9ACTN|nr:ABC transporter ATP-binding protein [Nocardioides zeae]MDR6175845.1 ATP-binding cassette subfamily B protein [Nocardioides zeae]MDR6208773.1 ATP-binding cassette subfamily B protein [Nocardioides zeae]
MSDTSTLSDPSTARDRAAAERSARAAADGRQRIDWRRLRGPAATVALVLSFLGALGETLGTVVAGRLAAGPSGLLVGVLAACVVGGAVVDAVGRVVWAGVVDRAEGRLRDDLLDAALDQPLAALGEQGVGEILDRVDDDTHDVGTLARRQVWSALRTVFAALPMWIVAGVTWWPAWLLFPVMAVVVGAAVRPLLPDLTRRKIVEEVAWTDHATAFEEGIAARDDLRTSLGQAYVLRRVSELAAVVHARLRSVVQRQIQVTYRTGLLLHALLAAVGVVGVALVLQDDLTVARLVTLFLVTTLFVGQVEEMARHLPDLQAGLGALVRLRQLHEAEREPTDGLAVPGGAVEVRFAGLDFTYAEGTFRLVVDDLVVPAGETLALVGRSGSGKSTLAALVSRAQEPPRGSVLLGDADVRDLDLQALRRTVGVVTQRTELVAGTLAENIALFGDAPPGAVEAAVDDLGLGPWVAGLEHGLDTRLGPGGTTLSSGEEQLVAFARLLVRDVQVVVLDEATARMDPRTEMLVVRAADRLLRGRTGLLVAHRLSTTERAARVAVLSDGRVVQQGARAVLARRPGPFRDLLDGADEVEAADEVEVAAADPSTTSADPTGIGAVRRRGEPPQSRDPGPGPSLARGIVNALMVRPWWGLFATALFLASALAGAFGAVSAFLWGRIVQQVAAGDAAVGLLVGLVVSLLLGPVLLNEAMRRYPRWWIEILLRVRTNVLVAQTDQRRLPRDPAGEIAARAMDADRFARYADRWVDFTNAAFIVVVTTVLGGSLLAGGVLLAVMVGAAAASALGRPVAGRSAATAATARAGFGRALVSVLDAARTVKLAAATDDVRAHLRRVDAGRVDAAVREHRVQAALDGVPLVIVQLGVVTAWGVYFAGGWDLATALLVAAAVTGFDYFGLVVGWVITEAPGTRAWQRATATFAGGRDLTRLPPGVDLVAGTAPAPVVPEPVEPLEALHLRGLTAVHDDGTIGVEGVDLDVRRGELVLLLGQVGSGKSSLLGAVAGLVSHRGELRWNERAVDDAETFLRPSRVAYVAQVPRVLSGTFADNLRLDHPREIGVAARTARLERDLAAAGGLDAIVGHRGVRLSGGQVQRVALARALATEADLLVADDVSSALDATTELELWRALRDRGTTVLGSTSKRSALARADQVVVLVDGRIAATGPWSELAPSWGHLAG